MTMIRVTTASRLHFGPFSLPAGAPAPWPDLDGRASLPARSFGGVGLMVRQPGLIVAVEPAASWHADGPFAERALAFARHCAAALACEQPCRLCVTTAAREHVGLGSGTQLGLAVARALAVLAGRPDLDAVALARLVGRGQRSALGIHGFAHGGFLVEAGKRAGNDCSPLVARQPFPDDWRVVLVLPHGLQGEHGPREREAFQQLEHARAGLPATEALCRLVLLGLLPALVEQDVEAFGAALYDFNRRAGELFRPWQGDVYAHPWTAGLVRVLREAGVAGVGQSSWGPAVFAVVESAERAAEVAGLMARAGGTDATVIVTAAANDGARLEIVGTGPGLI